MRKEYWPNSATYGRISGTLCFDCQRSVPTKDDHICPWSLSGQPVPGWNATPTEYGKVKGKDHVMKSYCVHTCPLFLPDEERETTFW